MVVAHRDIKMILIRSASFSTPPVCCDTVLAADGLSKTKNSVKVPTAKMVKLFQCSSVVFRFDLLQAKYEVPFL